MLIATAGLKMTGGSHEALRVALPFASPRVYAVGIVFEALLGAWLLTGLAPAWSWLTGLTFFGLLAGLSFRMGVLGQASCGCAGRIPLSPWWAFGIDAAAILGLLACRPREITHGIKAALPSIAIGGVILSGIGIALAMMHGSAGAAWARLSGETIAVSPLVSDLGSGPRGQMQSISITLTNYSDKPVRIVGGTSDCSCVATADLPITLQPNESNAITVRVKFTGSAGEFRRKFKLYADDDRLRVMPVAVTGRVIENP